MSGSAATRLALASTLDADRRLRARRPRGVGGGARRAADPRPHVVVIMTDDQTVNDLGSMRLTRGLLARGG